MIRVAPSATSKTTQPTEAQPAAKAAKELEGVFLRQLLSTAKFGGAKAGSTYGGMAVDALASGLSDAGGVGLAAMIERSLDTHRAPPAAAAAKDKGSVDP
jgi:Rod binding domain-containing protein